jgi:nucleoid-associated protein YgaU
VKSIPGPTTGTLGYIAELDGGGAPSTTKRVDFHFNPSKITMATGTGGGGASGPGGTTASTGQGPWAPAGNAPRGRTPSGGAGSGPPSSPSNTNQSVGPVKLQLANLFFDGGYEKSVLPECLQLFDWFKPSSNGTTGTHTPPRPTLVLKIGSTTWMKGQITNLSIDFLIFNPQGIPTRAKVASLEMTGEDSALPRQNPTSGGMASYSSVVLGAGDSLESIAYQTYGHPRLWRQLALVNGIDDPLRVRPGTTVMLPTLNEIVKVD